MISSKPGRCTFMLTLCFLRCLCYFYMRFTLAVYFDYNYENVLLSTYKNTYVSPILKVQNSWVPHPFCVNFSHAPFNVVIYVMLYLHSLEQIYSTKLKNDIQQTKVQKYTHKQIVYSKRFKQRRQKKSEYNIINNPIHCFYKRRKTNKNIYTTLINDKYLCIPTKENATLLYRKSLYEL